MLKMHHDNLQLCDSSGCLPPGATGCLCHKLGLKSIGFFFADHRNGQHFSNSTSALVSILGQEKYMQVSRMTTHARTVPPSERCFFVLLLLVTFIYAIGILTALVLLCFHMWFFQKAKLTFWPVFSSQSTLCDAKFFTVSLKRLIFVHRSTSKWVIKLDYNSCILKYTYWYLKTRKPVVRKRF